MPQPRTCRFLLPSHPPYQCIGVLVEQLRAAPARSPLAVLPLRPLLPTHTRVLRASDQSTTRPQLLIALISAASFARECYTGHHAIPMSSKATYMVALWLRVHLHPYW
ncbi:hypothetical protein PENSPDRAFT_345471 [Peniophora sp. CONT]|nr:hypothetical protein PENSPDRAFT_345471 [Peniophora sp. CONT]